MPGSTTLRAELRDDTAFVATAAPAAQLDRRHRASRGGCRPPPTSPTAPTPSRSTVATACSSRGRSRRSPRARRARSRCARGRPSGAETAWSAPLRVEAGFLADGEWIAQPIGLAEPAREAQPALVRTTFTIDRPVRRATAVLDRARRRRARAQRRAPSRTTCSRPDGRATATASCTRPSMSPRSSARARTCSARRSPAPGTPRSTGSSTSPHRLYGTQPSFLAQLRVDVRRRHRRDARRHRRRVVGAAATAPSSTAASTRASTRTCASPSRLVRDASA